MKKVISSAFAVFAVIVSSYAQTPCVNGFAGIYPCDQVDLMSILENEVMNNVSGLNDIWGWTDTTTCKEYALVGAIEGTAFVDVSDPLEPCYLGFLPTHTVNSTWRDIKVYRDHAFIVSEASDHGMQVFDLQRLTNLTATEIPSIFSADAHYDGFGNCHNIALNERTGFAYAIGTSTFSGGPHFIDVSSPTNPVAAGGYEDEGYTHDAQIVVYNGPDSDYVGREVFFGNNGNSGAPFVIVDVSDKADPQLVSASFYDSLGYSHQGWLTEDHRFFIHNDETDEISFGFNTRTHMWDLLDLDAPIYMGYYESSSPASDHNLYTKGDFVFQSNYRAGLRILNSADIGNGNMTEVGFFDIFPASDAVNTGGGTWSNYPYFNSGNVIVTHRGLGLFVVRPVDQTIVDANDDYYMTACDDIPAEFFINPCDLTDNLTEHSSSTFNIYPNPGSGMFTIESEKLSSLVGLTVYDIYGQIVMNIELSDLSSQEQLELDLSHVATGVYHVRLRGQEDFVVKLLVD